MDWSLASAALISRDRQLSFFFHAKVRFEWEKKKTVLLTFVCIFARASNNRPTNREWLAGCACVLQRWLGPGTWHKLFSYFFLAFVKMGSKRRHSPLIPRILLTFRRFYGPCFSLANCGCFTVQTAYLRYACLCLMPCWGLLPLLPGPDGCWFAGMRSVHVCEIIGAPMTITVARRIGTGACHCFPS
jgi:hypothetical protein